VRWADPPLMVERMANVRLSPAGDLEQLRVVAPRRVDAWAAARATGAGSGGDSTAAGDPDNGASPGDTPGANTDTLLRAAGFENANVAPATLQRTPPVYCDERFAWEVTCPDLPDRQLVVEAGADRGRWVYLEKRGQWSSAPPVRSAQFESIQSATQAATLLSILLALVGTVWLAWRNARTGRADRRGAMRLAVALAIASMFAWVFSADHVTVISSEVELFARGLSVALLQGGLTWVLYLALEPAIRRRWPEAMVSWTRLLAGKLGDPLVGRDILLGGLVGLLAVLIECVPHLIAWIARLPPPRPTPAALDALLLTSRTLQVVFESTLRSVSMPMFLLVVVVLLWMVLRRRWAAVLLTYVLYVLLNFVMLAFSEDYGWLRFAAASAAGAMFTLALLRFGLLTLIVAMQYETLINVAPLNLDLSSWFAPNTILVFVLLAGLATFGYWRALDGRPLVRVAALES
jgi:serine/threonine-protein kinase